LPSLTQLNDKVMNLAGDIGMATTPIAAKEAALISAIQASEEAMKERGIPSDKMIEGILWDVYEALGKRLRTGAW
jgi:hypothetical protein